MTENNAQSIHNAYGSIQNRENWIIVEVDDDEKGKDDAAVWYCENGVSLSLLTHSPHP
jgi:hypothetical protein